MDTTVSPAENFFLYANGAWLKKTEIPGDQTRWGSFDMLAENTNEDVHKVMEAAATNKDAAAGSKERMIGDFYKSGMDTAAIEKAGIAPVKPILDRIAAITNPEQFLAEVALQFTQGNTTIIAGYVAPDDKIITKQIVQLGQTGLGLPTGDNYFDKDTISEKNRVAYKAYVTKILELTGEDNATAAKNADAIFALETKLAGASLRPDQMRDPQKLYNKFSLDAFTKQTPGIDWKVLFDQFKIKGEDSLIVSNPKYYQELARQLKATPVDVWKQYLTFHVTSDMAPYLSSAFSNAAFDFYGTTLRGQKVQKPRWKRVMSIINGSVGDQLGQLYVDKNFKPEAKKRMQEMVNNLQEAFRDRITKLDWMSRSNQTKSIGKAEFLH